MTDDKPDALAELKVLPSMMRRDSRFLANKLGQPASMGPLDAYAQDVERAIAAWEKERAEHAARRDRKALCEQYERMAKAVEKVRDELRIPGPPMTLGHRQRLADALDAALRGGA